MATVLLPAKRDPKALLMATDLDAFDLVGADGRHLPGNGALVRSARASIGCFVVARVHMPIAVEHKQYHSNYPYDLLAFSRLKHHIVRLLSIMD